MYVYIYIHIWQFNFFSGACIAFYIKLKQEASSNISFKVLLYCTRQFIVFNKGLNVTSL